MDKKGNRLVVTILPAIKYYPYGGTRSGYVPTDKKFTGQRLDDTGLYYYGSRYYDAEIGRFISADSIIPNPANPQAFNRYSYVLNNPLKYTDPSGHKVEFENEEEVLQLLEEIGLYGGTYGDEIWDMIMEWLENRSAWEELCQQQQEPDYTQYMIDSDIIFKIVDIHLPSKTISYLVDMPLISFNEPVQLSFVRQGPEFDFMKKYKSLGVSLYPGSIFIPTDKARGIERFTWLVAHESYHRWEQSIFEFNWYKMYLLESPLPWNWRPSEIRANIYANYYFPVN